MRYDKYNVECFNCHKCGHYSWKCRTNVKEKANLLTPQVEEPIYILLEVYLQIPSNSFQHL